jgi:hypothetical protein
MVGVGLLVEFLRIGPPALAGRPVGCRCDCHIFVPFISNVMGGAKKACYWSFFEAKLQPDLTIESGDEITIDTISCGHEVGPDGWCQATS